ncbi:O-methyltransferase [Sinanaerobacter chloroacetimidivorans]|uniref:tRNA 5-hydroxyuridine methyltransferase n=1 Tax=Sinanaerobacter chloroacetimidivorans TaxID=2818044 RepID=A0A8J7VXM8_9FIRM|nr:O-methyltransferase [Sinanaerobacter chloroacetimidivorans]MBR0596644.1 O-methyltransferase [Sinanaerobacter chloroacetimidivorans]
MNIVNDKVTAYIDSLYQPVNEFLKDLRQSAEADQIPIILRDTETLILNLIRLKKPARILEIGTAVGYSSICFASALPNVEITSLEINQAMYRIASENIEKAGLTHRIRLILGDARKNLKTLTAAIKNVETEGYDMVFIDAAKSRYLEFFSESSKLCKPESVIISDNVLLKARTVSDEYITDRRQKTSVRRMREYLPHITNPAVADTSVLAVGDGVAVSIINRRNL